jgi:hypothetical protein
MALFKHPFTAIVAGPTKAGKTVWVQKLVQNIGQMVSPTPQEVYWCYSEWQPLYSDLEASSTIVRFMQGIPDLQQLKSSPEKPKMLILDDFMQEMKTDKRLVQLFTKGSHHWNVSIVHIVQNLFFEGLRTSRVNAQYLILMKNPSDKLQAATLAKQLYPGQTPYFMEAYSDACKDSYGYLFVDLCQETPENMRLRSRVFPGELQIAYLPKL